MKTRRIVVCRRRKQLLFGKHAAEVRKAHIFREWVRSLCGRLRVKRITIQSVDFFGKGTSRRIGFIKLKVRFQGGGHLQESIILLRGGAVAVLVILLCRRMEYVVITEQTRLAINQVTGIEMLDVIRECLAFKNTEGAFVKRRLRAAVRDWNKGGHKPLDDLSYGVIIPSSD